MLVYFGYANPIEDAAGRGVQAALDALDGVARLHTPAGRLATRIGMASGLVVVDGHRPGAPPGTGRAFGATVNLAARLQAEAQPGGLILSEATAALVRDAFELRPLGARRLKGIDAPTPLFQIMGRRAADPAATGARPGRARFVNRRTERATLATAWEAACEGEGGVVVISGEAGMGKSRLVYEFLGELERGTTTIRRYACVPHGQDTPFHPFLGRADAIAAEVAPAIAPESATASTTASTTARRRHRARRIAALAAGLARPTADAPHVVWFDDLHWADPSTAAVVEALLARPHPRLLVIVTTRPKTTALWHDAACPVREIALSALSSDHTMAIIRSAMGELARGREGLVDALTLRADGVPIFAEELGCEMRGRLAAPVEGDADGSERGQGIPASLQQSLQARIDRLHNGRPLLRLAASYGRESPVAMLRDLWPGPGSFDSALAELVEAGFALLRHGTAEEREDRLVIRHQMVRECAYDMILTRDRKRIHRAIAEVLEDRAARGIEVAATVMADHLERAGRPAEAAAAWAEAGRRAAAQSADAEAVALYRRALALVPGIGDAEARDRFEADTLLELLPALIGAEGYRASAPDVMQRVGDLIARTGGGRRFFSAMFYHWLDILAQGDIDTAHDFSIGLLPMTVEDPGRVHRMVLDRMLGSTYMFRGEFARARRHLDRFLADYRPAEHAEPLRRFGATDNHATVLCCIAAIEAFEGSDAVARSAVARALASAEASQHLHTLCHTLTFGAALPAGIRGNWAELDAHRTRLAELAETHGLGFWSHVLQLLSGIALVSRGEAAAGAAAFDAGVAALQAHGFRFMVPTFRLLCATAALAHDPRAIVAPDLAALEAELAHGERWLLADCAKLRVARA